MREAGWDLVAMAAIVSALGLIIAAVVLIRVGQWPWKAPAVRLERKPPTLPGPVVLLYVGDDAAAAKAAFYGEMRPTKRISPSEPGTYRVFLNEGHLEFWSDGTMRNRRPAAIPQAAR